MAGIRTREDRVRSSNIDDFFAFASSVLADVSRKLEGGFSGGDDRRQTIELLRQTR